MVPHPYNPYFDRSGASIAEAQWIKLYADPAYHRVARSTLTESTEPEHIIHVSTVWTGIDHSFGGAAAPMIFETLISENDIEDGRVAGRYSSEADALIGHHQHVTEQATLVMTYPVITADEPPECPADVDGRA